MFHSRRFRNWSMTLSAGFLIGLLSVGLTACGYNGAAQGQGSTSPAQQPAQAQTTPAPRSTPTQATQPTQQGQVQKCGVVAGFGILETVPQDGAQAARVEDCFWQAFQHCRPATLIFTSGGATKKFSGLMFTRTFTIHTANGGCSVSDTLQQGTFPNGLRPASAVYACTGLKRLASSLQVLSCGRDGNVDVVGI